MIKAAGSLDGKPLLLIGLSGENLARLAAGEPILFDAAALGLPPMAVLICYGRTEQDIFERLQDSGFVDSVTRRLNPQEGA